MNHHRSSPVGAGKNSHALLRPGGAFVTGIEGDHHNVVGLSLPLLRTLLLELGVAWPQLWGEAESLR